MKKKVYLMREAKKRGMLWRKKFIRWEAVKHCGMGIKEVMYVREPDCIEDGLV